MKNILNALLSAIAIIIICQASSCSNDNDVGVDEINEVKDGNGVVISKDFFWKTDITQEGPAPSFIAPVLYNNEIVALGGSGFNGTANIRGLDVKKGENLWIWDEAASDAILLDEQGFSTNGSTWIIQDASNFYAINLTNGETIWKDDRSGDGARAQVQIINDEYYFYLDFENDQIPSLFKGSINNNSFERVLTPPIDSINLDALLLNYGDMDNPLIYEENGDLFAFLQFGEWVDRIKGQVNAYVALYNLTSKEFVFPRKFLVDRDFPFQGRPVKYENVFIINVDSKLYGISSVNGDIVWQRGFDTDGDGLFQYGIYEDLFIAVNTIGDESFAIAIDPLTGNNIWENKGVGGGSSALSFLNGVLYWTDRTDGKLHALEASTGKQLWKIGIDEFFGFMNSGVAVIPGENNEKGKVIVTSFNNAYCFEAAR